jgi:hypothetical protein
MGSFAEKLGEASREPLYATADSLLDLWVAHDAAWLSSH